MVSQILLGAGSDLMGWRFQRRKRILPGVRLNIGKKSIGITIRIGPFSYSTNSSGRRTLTTRSGIPGLWHSQSLNRKGAGKQRSSSKVPATAQLASTGHGGSASLASMLLGIGAIGFLLVVSCGGLLWLISGPSATSHGPTLQPATSPTSPAPLSALSTSEQPGFPSGNDGEDSTLAASAIPAADDRERTVEEWSAELEDLQRRKSHLESQAPEDIEFVFREWSSKNGKYTVPAKLLHTNFGIATQPQAVIERQDTGQQITVNLYDLSEADMGYLRESARKLSERKYFANELAKFQQKTEEKRQAIERLRAEIESKPKPEIGKVVGVTDGDSITLLINKSQVKVRLNAIDAPERSQEFGSAAKSVLSDLVHGKSVSFVPLEKDKYGRTVADVFVGDTYVNKEMIEKGLAWHYKEYSDSEELAQAENEARKAKVGLWAHINPMAPWVFRHLPPTPKTTTHQSTSTALRDSTPGTSSRPPPQTATRTHWLNTSSYKRHNSGCRWYKNTSSGRMCGPNEGSACGICGG